MDNDQPPDNRMVMLTISQLEDVVDHELEKYESIRKHHETRMEKIEGSLFMGGFAVCCLLLVFHAYIDWVSLLVGLPGARVMVSTLISGR